MTASTWDQRLAGARAAVIAGRALGPRLPVGLRDQLAAVAETVGLKHRLLTAARILEPERGWNWPAQGIATRTTNYKPTPWPPWPTAEPVAISAREARNRPSPASPSTGSTATAACTQSAGRHQTRTTAATGAAGTASTPSPRSASSSARRRHRGPG